MTAPTLNRLVGKTAIVTGAYQGIGRGIVERFLTEGAKVAALDVAYEGKPGELVDDAHENLAIANADVGDKVQVDAAVAAAVERFGGIDICVNSAGLIHAADFLDVEEDDFHRVLRVNLTGTFLVGQAAARQMVAAGTKGSIINLSSVNAVVAHANQIPYCASKGAVNQLTKSMALSLVGKGIRVNAIGPGSIATDMLMTILKGEAARAKIMSRTPMGRLGEVDEMATIAVFLASDDAGYITGQTIYADGGRLPLAYTC